MHRGRSGVTQAIAAKAVFLGEVCGKAVGLISHWRCGTLAHRHQPVVAQWHCTLGWIPQHALCMVHHHSLSRRDPEASLARRRASMATRDLYSTATDPLTADTKAVFKLSSCLRRCQRFQALFLASTASLHSGVHHDGSVCFRVSFLLGMNRRIWSRIVLVSWWHDKSGSSVMTSVQTTRLRWARIRPQSASL